MTGRKRLRVAVSSGDVYLVPGDMHFPTHDEDAVDAMVRWFEEEYGWRGNESRRGVILQGDTLDCYGLSRYPKRAARLWADSRLKDEVASATPFLTWAGSLPLGCTMILGNHEDRLNDLLDGHPELHGSNGANFAAMTGLSSIPGLDVLDHGSRVCLGDKVVICHGDVDRFPRRPHLVAAKYPDHVTLWGHTHQVSHHAITVYDSAGAPQVRGAYNVGHMCNVAAQDYTDDPSWQTGFAVVEFFGERGGEGQGSPRPFFRVQQHLVFRDSEGRAVVA